MFKGKTAIVTGAAVGIGRAVAMVLAGLAAVLVILFVPKKRKRSGSD